jgi:hypothetical protein
MPRIEWGDSPMIATPFFFRGPDTQCYLLNRICAAMARAVHRMLNVLTFMGDTIWVMYHWRGT